MLGNPATAATFQLTCFFSSCGTSVPTLPASFRLVLLQPRATLAVSSFPVLLADSALPFSVLRVLEERSRREEEAKAGRCCLPRAPVFTTAQQVEEEEPPRAE